MLKHFKRDFLHYYVVDAADRPTRRHEMKSRTPYLPALLA
jgi:hypothetical protein